MFKIYKVNRGSTLATLFYLLYFFRRKRCFKNMSVKRNTPNFASSTKLEINEQTYSEELHGEDELRLVRQWLRRVVFER